MKTRHLAAVCAASLLAATAAQAEGWTHEFAPYLWGAGMNGTTGVRDLEANVDMSFGDILQNLQMGFMGTYVGTHDKFSIAVDGIYMNLGAAAHGPLGYSKADVDLQQTALEVDAGYEVVEHLTVFGGLRYIDLQSAVKLHGALGDTRKADLSQDWVDPVIGARYLIPINDQWSASLRGDIGGFGVGSDFAWQGIALLRWQAKPAFGVVAAYRYIDMNYEDGHGSDHFKYDMAMSGPALGMVFTF
jgi:hypothetical protein